MKRITFLLAFASVGFGSSAFADGLLPNVTIGGHDTVVVVVRPNAPDLIVPVSFSATAPSGIYELRGSWSRTLTFADGHSRVQTRVSKTRMKNLGGVGHTKEVRLREPGNNWDVGLSMTHDGTPVPFTGGTVATGGPRVRTTVPMTITGVAGPVNPPVDVFPAGMISIVNGTSNRTLGAATLSEKPSATLPGGGPELSGGFTPAIAAVPAGQLLQWGAFTPPRAGEWQLQFRFGDGKAIVIALPYWAVGMKIVITIDDSDVH
jgi:hypothetical protein